MKFCSYCGAAVVKRVPPGDSLPRWVCDQCGIVHYQNPLLVVGSIPVSEDRLLLDARAEARGMRPATYVSVLIRSHLRQLAPLPKDELLALKRSIGELASIGRNVNQIAKAVNEGGRAPGSVREEFRAMLKICEALRDNTKSLLKANVTSWETGHAEADL